MFKKARSATLGGAAKFLDYLEGPPGEAADVHVPDVDSVGGGYIASPEISPTVPVVDASGRGFTCANGETNSAFKKDVVYPVYDSAFDMEASDVGEAAVYFRQADGQNFARARYVFESDVDGRIIVEESVGGVLTELLNVEHFGGYGEAHRVGIKSGNMGATVGVYVDKIHVGDVSPTDTASHIIAISASSDKVKIKRIRGK